MNRGIVCNKRVIWLKSINWSAVKRHPKDPRPVIVLLFKPILEWMDNASFPLIWVALTINKGRQNMYLKNKIIKTDSSPDINFTKLAIVIVKITSKMEKNNSFMNIRLIKKNKFITAINPQKIIYF